MNRQKCSTQGQIDIPSRRIIVPDIGHGYELGQLIRAYLGLHGSGDQTSFPADVVFSSEGIPLPLDNRVETGDVLWLNLKAVAQLCGPVPPMTILFEDRDLLVLDKPPNLLAHPAGGTFEWTALDAAKLMNPKAQIDLGHRLDRQTSGVLILAKNKNATTHVKREFEQRRVNKTYRALVFGRPSWTTQECRLPIAHANDSSRVRRMVAESGQAAFSTFTVINSTERVTDMLCQPRTGRSHQLRVHLHALGIPIIGDRLYRRQPSIDVNTQALEHTHPERHALHCSAIELTALSGGTVHLNAPLPKDMERTWAEALNEFKAF